jgi:hypothetical protein
MRAKKALKHKGIQPNKAVIYEDGQQKAPQQGGRCGAFRGTGRETRRKTASSYGIEGELGDKTSIPSLFTLVPLISIDRYGSVCNHKDSNSLTKGDYYPVEEGKWVTVLCHYAFSFTHSQVDTVTSAPLIVILPLVSQSSQR